MSAGPGFAEATFGDQALRIAKVVVLILIAIVAFPIVFGLMLASMAQERSR